MLSSIFTKQCRGCNVVKLTTDYSVDHRFADGFYSKCKVCELQRKRLWRNTHRGFINKLLDSARGGVRGKRLGHDINQSDIEQLLVQQNERCYYSQLPMVLQLNSDWRCSLERLSNEIGYYRGNIALCCSEFNTPFQWNEHLINALPFLIEQDSSELVEMESEIWFLHEAVRMKRQGKRKRICAICTNVVIKNNGFCESCKRRYPESMETLRFIKYKLHFARARAKSRGKMSAKRGLYELSVDYAMETL